VFCVRESDIREIRKLLKSYVTRLENKDIAARTTKEWRIVARVLDRIFFFCYIGTIVVSLFTILGHVPGSCPRRKSQRCRQWYHGIKFIFIKVILNLVNFLVVVRKVVFTDVEFMTIYLLKSRLP